MRPEDVYGEVAVQEVKRALLQSGRGIFRLDLATRGGAPMIELPNERVVTPDLLVTNGGASEIGEVKWKDSPVTTRSHDLGLPGPRHGIDAPNWDDYLESERTSGIPGTLYVIQYRPDRGAAPDPRLLWAAFASLATRIDGTTEPACNRCRFKRCDCSKRVNPKFADGGVYWHVSRFQSKPWPLSAASTRRLNELPPLSNREPHPWERKGVDGLTPAQRAKERVVGWVQERLL